MRELHRSSSKDSDEAVCPRCGGYWYQDLDEEGKPYTCFFCCNGTVKITHEMIDEYIGGKDISPKKPY